MKWFFAFLFLALPAVAQPMQVVSSCGAVTLLAGDGVNGFVDTTGHLCTSASGGGGGSVTQGTIPWVVATATATPTVSASGSVTSLVLNASPTIASGGVKYFHAENATATTGYCILYNATAAPGTGALTAANVLAFQLLPASGYCDWMATNAPIAASAGAVVLISSAATPFTYTTGVITAAIYGLAQ